MKRAHTPLEPDEIFIDAHNLPSFDTAHLEGRLERPLNDRTYRAILTVFACIGFLVLGRTLYLSVIEYEHYATWAADNHVQQATVIAERGRILDRTGVELATNASHGTSSQTYERTYPLGVAAAHLVGYVSYPKHDASGTWYQDETIGVEGVEALFNDTLKGQNGLEIRETDATGAVQSGSVVRTPIEGRDVVLTIDAELQAAAYQALARAADAAYIGGAVAIMDINTGALYALASYPSFDPGVMSSGEPKEVVESYVKNQRSPFVDRAVSGLYTPGSIVKPFVALAALEEGVVDEHTTFVSTGKLVVPNPYDPEKPSVFKDWRAHGAVDLTRALAVSSDVYFYIVGGGFENQRGVGISAIDRYARRFGFGAPTGFYPDEEPKGTVPNPEWKAATFGESAWRVGDTYNTAIGQYGWQVTLLQALQAVAALGNGGTLVRPTMVQGERIGTHLNIDDAHLKLVQNGMRAAVTEGTAQVLSLPEVRVAAKTGTAETGARKEFTNSLVIGFFPFEEPRFAFAAVLERARAGTLVGTPALMRTILEWVVTHRPQMIVDSD